MAESIKQVIERLKSQQQNSQKSEIPVPKPTKKVMDEEIEEDDEFGVEELPTPQEKPAVKPKSVQIEASEKQEELSEEDKIRNQILIEIEMLQNNGRYRVELLHQLQEINKALVVIAGVLVDLSGNGKQN